MDIWTVETFTYPGCSTYAIDIPDYGVLVSMPIDAGGGRIVLDRKELIRLRDAIDRTILDENHTEVCDETKGHMDGHEFCNFGRT